MIRVIIVEDEPATARGLKLLITQNYVNCEVIAICDNGRDGLQKILELKPDLVFADIEMPIVDGLEMIRQCKQQLDSVQFVILTGYSEFQYARTAITLGVTEYLLKPITTNSLDNIMSTCYRSCQVARRLFLTEYLQHHLTGDPCGSKNPFPLECSRVTLLFLFFGPMQSNLYNQLLVTAQDYIPPQTLLSELERTHHISILSLHGRHPNERIYALVYPQSHEPDIEEIASALYQSVNIPDSFFNLILSNAAENESQLLDIIQETYLYALFRVPFGYSSMSHSAPVSEPLANVSSTVKQFCSCLSDSLTRSDLHQLIQSMVSHWKQSRFSQYMLTSDLRYFVSSIMYHKRKENLSYPDVAEIISNAQSYEDLCKDLQYELEQLCHFSDGETAAPELTLAETVRSWLDNNFTTPITYKIFQDLFGYNEKYISALFKKEYGVSPNKYVGKLRLDMAKKLMQSNPNILLKDVAALTGFTDVFYFSRVFKAQEGISPNQYMKNLKNE